MAYLITQREDYTIACNTESNLVWVKYAEWKSFICRQLPFADGNKKITKIFITRKGLLLLDNDKRLWSVEIFVTDGFGKLLDLKYLLEPHLELENIIDFISQDDFFLLLTTKLELFTLEETRWSISWKKINAANCYKGLANIVGFSSIKLILSTNMITIKMRFSEMESRSILLMATYGSASDGPSWCRLYEVVFSSELPGFMVSELMHAELKQNENPQSACFQISASNSKLTPILLTTTGQILKTFFDKNPSSALSHLFKSVPRDFLSSLISFPWGVGIYIINSNQGCYFSPYENLLINITGYKSEYGVIVATTASSLTNSQLATQNFFAVTEKGTLLSLEWKPEEGILGIKFSEDFSVFENIECSIENFWRYMRYVSPAFSIELNTIYNNFVANKIELIARERVDTLRDKMQRPLSILHQTPFKLMLCFLETVNTILLRRPDALTAIKKLYNTECEFWNKVDKQIVLDNGFSLRLLFSWYFPVLPQESRLPLEKLYSKFIGQEPLNNTDVEAISQYEVSLQNDVILQEASSVSGRKYSLSLLNGLIRLIKFIAINGDKRSAWTALNNSEWLFHEQKIPQGMYCIPEGLADRLKNKAFDNHYAQVCFWEILRQLLPEDCIEINSLYQQALSIHAAQMQPTGGPAFSADEKIKTLSRKIGIGQLDLPRGEKCFIVLTKLLYVIENIFKGISTQIAVNDLWKAERNLHSSSDIIGSLAQSFGWKTALTPEDVEPEPSTHRSLFA